ncbi:MAG: NADH-ubiquinone oxidoreductase-F iron-sulfur binding region domain-containing protein [Frankia sp.]
MTSVIEEWAAAGTADPATADPSWPRLLRPTATGRAPTDLEDHLRLWGWPAGLDDPRGRAIAELIDAVAAAGLGGRGGAGFPTADKMRSVAGAAGRRKPVVVVNAAESEPASAKDRALLAGAPHLVLDGAQLAAAAVGAWHITVAVHRGDPAADGLAAAIRDRAARWPAAATVEIAQVPRRYVASQETALVRWLSGGEARPAVAPPRPSERGVRRHPTLVQNAETMAHIALISRFGPAWFRSVGTPDEPGTRLLTVSGAVAAPGVYEVAGGMRGADVLAAAGGCPVGVRAVLVGGYGGRWLPAEEFRSAPLTTRRAPGSVALGAGVVIALPTSGCGVRETARIAGWLAGQSAGQCGPCAFGLPAISDQLSALAAGSLDRNGVATLERWAGQVRGRGACAHPDGVAQLVTSALTVFADEIDQHVDGRCSARPDTPPVCPLPIGTEEEPWR